MTKCSVCNRDIIEVDVKVSKALANLPRYLMMINKENFLHAIVAGNYCSVDCLKKKFEEVGA